MRNSSFSSLYRTSLVYDNDDDDDDDDIINMVQNANGNYCYYNYLVIVIFFLLFHAVRLRINNNVCDRMQRVMFKYNFLGEYLTWWYKILFHYTFERAFELHYEIQNTAVCSSICSSSRVLEPTISLMFSPH